MNRSRETGRGGSSAAAAAFACSASNARRISNSPGKFALHVRPYVFVERQVLGLRFGETHLEMRAAVLPFVERIGHQDFGSARGLITWFDARCTFH